MLVTRQTCFDTQKEKKTPTVSVSSELHHPLPCTNSCSRGLFVSEPAWSTGCMQTVAITCWNRPENHWLVRRPWLLMLKQAWSTGWMQHVAGSQPDTDPYTGAYPPVSSKPDWNVPWIFCCVGHATNETRPKCCGIFDYPVSYANSRLPFEDWKESLQRCSKYYSSVTFSGLFAERSNVPTICSVVLDSE